MKEKSIKKIQEELNKLKKQAAESNCLGWFLKMTGGNHEFRKTIKNLP